MNATDVRLCSVCGTDVNGEDFLAVVKWQFYREGQRGHQTYLTKKTKTKTVDEYLHRSCVSMFVEGQYIRLNYEKKVT